MVILKAMTADGTTHEWTLLGMDAVRWSNDANVWVNPRQFLQWEIRYI